MGANLKTKVLQDDADTTWLGYDLTCSWVVYVSS